MALQDLLKDLDPNELGLIVLSEDDLHNVQLQLEKMLHDFDEVCNKHNINWCLSGGSIIGAVRHNGFIPWDDDVDIFMTRKDYNAFRKVAIDELGDRYILKEPGRAGYIYHFPQLQLRHTEVGAIQTTDESNDGLFVDIFILENAPNSKFIRILHGILCSFMLFIDSTVRQKLCRDHIFRYAGKDTDTVREVNKRAKFAFLFGFRKFENWLKSSDWVFAMCKNDNSKYVVCPSGRLHYFGEIYFREKMCRYTKHVFESHVWNIPEDYEYYLNKRYGSDYMTLPPIEKREKHLYVKLDLKSNSKGDIS